LTADITSSDTSLSVTSGDGIEFPNTGYLLIGTEIISYTAVASDTFSGLTRGCLDSTAAAHSSGDTIHTTAVQVSGTDEGGVPTWYTLTWGSEFVTQDNGKIYIYDDTLYSAVLINNNLLPKRDVDNRFRVSYYYGWDTIPSDITRLTLLLAQRSLFTDTIISSLIKGRNEFRPETMDVVQREIDNIVNVYANVDIRNT
jgi:hypothetical protein